MFGSPSSHGPRIDWCGGEVHPGRLAYGTSSAEVDFIIPEESDHVALLVPQDLLLPYLGEEWGQAASVRDRRHLACHTTLGDELVGIIYRLIDDCLARPALLANERVCKAIEWQLLGTLVQAFIDGNASARCVSPRKRRSAFLRAIEYGEELRQPIAVPELAAAAGVSQRVLELVFRETLNTTPRRYLRWNRMNRAQRELLAAGAGSALVKEIATNWGFADMGRFAVEYKWLFRESPSETLARKASNPSARLADILGRASKR